MPGVGEPLDLPDGRLREIRVATVTKFRNFLIFYRATPSGIAVVRVRHGAMDVGAHFGPDEAEGPDEP